MIGTVFDIKEMAVHDGPGIRTTVFLKGCPLRCRWCHNPEGFSFEPQLMFKGANCKSCGNCLKECEHEECKPFGRCIFACSENCLEIAGRRIDSKTLAKELISSAEVLDADFGGITFSGGEPLAQSEFLLELINELKGYHLCIETSGFCDSKIFKKVIQQLDFVIMDLKLADGKAHKEYTGVSNELILKNFRLLKNSGKPYLIRTPLIPNITDTEENLTAINEIIGDSPWEKLPFNTLWDAKYKMMGIGL